MFKYNKIEPLIGSDIPLLPCIYENECENYDDSCPYDCEDYQWNIENICLPNLPKKGGKNVN
jgi:hypothetical protein